MKIWIDGTTSMSRYVREQGVESLVTLREAVMTKEGKTYRYLHGPVFIGRLTTWSKHGTDVQVGTETTANHIITPMSNVVGIQECHKVLANPEVLVLK